jgi:hypothetical protein
VALSTRQAGLISALIYPVQFEADPCDGTDRVLRQVVERRALGASPMEYLAAIRDALASSDALDTLIPQDHSDTTIRRYLGEIAEAIERRWGSNTG